MKRIVSIFAMMVAIALITLGGCVWMAIACRVDAPAIATISAAFIELLMVVMIGVQVIKRARRSSSIEEAATSVDMENEQ